MNALSRQRQGISVWLQEVPLVEDKHVSAQPMNCSSRQRGIVKFCVKLTGEVLGSGDEGEGEERDAEDLGEHVVVRGTGDGDGGKRKKSFSRVTVALSLYMIFRRLSIGSP